MFAKTISGSPLKSACYPSGSWLNQYSNEILINFGDLLDVAEFRASVRTAIARAVRRVGESACSDVLHRSTQIKSFPTSTTGKVANSVG
jgi:hypothetical protein